MTIKSFLYDGAVLLVFVIFAFWICKSKYICNNLENADAMIYLQSCAEFCDTLAEVDQGAITALQLPNNKDVMLCKFSNETHRVEIYRPPCVAIDGTKFAIPIELWYKLYKRGEEK